MKYTETMITESKDIRNELIDRVEVLNKVKKVLTLPKMDVMTIQQVADFYEVPLDTIKKCYSRNQEEVDFDGVTLMSPKMYKDFTKGTACPVSKSASEKEVSNVRPDDIKNYEQYRTHIMIHIDENTDVMIPNRGIKVFPVRAILRVGMLLTQSSVAKEVRTQLLNVLDVVKETNPVMVTQEINKEQALYIDFTQKLINQDTNGMLMAFQNIVDYHNRHTLELEKKIDAIETANQELQLVNKNLSGEITTFSDRVTANNAVRTLANMVYPTVRNRYERMWQDVYKVLRGTYHIDLKIRKGKSKKKNPALSFLKDEEFEFLNKSIIAILDKYNIDTNDFFTKCQTV